MQCRREGHGEWQIAELPEDFQPTLAAPLSISSSQKPDYRTATPDQIRSYVSSKYQRKLEALANDPEKSDKLQKALDREIEGRIKKLEQTERRPQ